MGRTPLTRVSELNGRAVVDVDAAEKVGTVDHVVLDPDTRQVAGFLVSRGSSVTGERMHMAVPASAVRSIGPDAVTIRHREAVTDDQSDRLRQLPHAGDLVGRKVVTEDGRMLGRIADVVVDPRSGRIVGYPIGHGDILAKVEQLFRGQKHQGSFLAADAELKAGPDLIVAPETAVRDQWPEAEAGDASATPASPIVAPRESDDHLVVLSTTWPDVPPPGAQSDWLRQDKVARSETPDL